MVFTKFLIFSILDYSLVTTSCSEIESTIHKERSDNYDRESNRLAKHAREQAQ